MSNSILIDGVDTRAGLNQVGGSMDIYRELLSQLCLDIDERLPLIDHAPVESECAAFVTIFHAIKSGCANIGAAGLQQRSLALEMAARNGDIPFIASALAAYTDDVKKLVADIREALQR